MTGLFRIICTAFLLAGCTPPSTATPLVVAPYPKEYTCAQQKRAAAELNGLGENSVMSQMIADYGKERDELRKLHHMPKHRCR